MKTNQTDQPDTAQYKKYCRKILSHKIILASLIKECVEEFRDFDIHYICDNCIEGNPEISEIPDLGRDESKPDIQEEQKAFYDIRFYAVVPQSDQLIKLIINIDIPKKKIHHNARVKLGMYYAARLLSMQDEASFTQAHCRDANMAYSIWICPDDSGTINDAIVRYKTAEEVVLGQAPSEFSSGIMQVVTMYLSTCKQDSDDSKGFVRLMKILLSAKASIDDKTTALKELSDIVPDNMFEKDLIMIK